MFSFQIETFLTYQDLIDYQNAVNPTNPPLNGTVIVENATDDPDNNISGEMIYTFVNGEKKSTNITTSHRVDLKIQFDNVNEIYFVEINPAIRVTSVSIIGFVTMQNKAKVVFCTLQNNNIVKLDGLNPDYNAENVKIEYQKIN